MLSTTICFPYIIHFFLFFHLIPQYLAFLTIFQCYLLHTSCFCHIVIFLIPIPTLIFPHHYILFTRAYISAFLTFSSFILSGSLYLEGDIFLSLPLPFSCCGSCHQCEWLCNPAACLRHEETVKQINRQCLKMSSNRLPRTSAQIHTHTSMHVKKHPSSHTRTHTDEQMPQRSLHTSKYIQVQMQGWTQTGKVQHCISLTYVDCFDMDTTKAHIQDICMWHPDSSSGCCALLWLIFYLNRRKSVHLIKDRQAQN